MAALLLLLALAPAHAQISSQTPPRLPGKVSFDQKLNAQVPLDLMFRDESGQVVRLRQLFRGKPVLLNFMYFHCRMLCGLAMDGLTRSLTDLKFDIGDQFDVITVSIDPRDTPEAAAAQKDRYVKRYGRLDSAPGWHFLTGNETTIKQLTDAVGFHYVYLPEQDQFAHGTGVIFLTPSGRISHYLLGIAYDPRDVRLSLVQASGDKIGSLTDTLVLLCCQYDPATGKYTRVAMNFVRAGGVATLLGLFGFVGIMLRRDHKRGSKP
ncbi:MAG TPA: SCO family protein [Thermoanaerobaculia bacterium]|nr:SCO family protein [Thermoanaerobaculia bacterium]